MILLNLSCKNFDGLRTPCGMLVRRPVQVQNLGGRFLVAPGGRGHIHAWSVPVISISQKDKLGDFYFISGCCNSDPQALQDLSLKMQV